jgi:hypothetical protein
MLLTSIICSAQMKDKQSLVIVQPENRSINLHLTKRKHDNRGPKTTATIVYLGFNGIITLNQFTSPPNVRKDLQPAYIGSIVITTIVYTIFMFKDYE